MTNTTQFGHANCNIPEEEQIDIEYSIEERIEENISKLEHNKPIPGLQVPTVIPDHNQIIELNMP